MTTVKNLFVRNPLDWQIPNDGVAEVEQRETLLHELKMFVCDGEYATGLERILSSYNSNWSNVNQPAVWISGFYGTGKSHLAKVLHALWENQRFPDGSEPIGITELPAEISDLLRELYTHGKQAGGIFAASGILQHSIPLRKGILSILFKRLNLPENYQVARFILWMIKEGVYEKVVTLIKESGRDPQSEFGDMYTSPVLAETLMKSMPSGWSKDIDSTLDKIDRQFPVIDIERDITNDQMLETMTLLLSENGKFKCSLLVLDELQQYIGMSNDRGYDVQQVVQACSKRFGAKLLFVGTGQSAIVDTPLLDKLQGRFTVRVHLSDTDVVKVTRKLVLRKKPEQNEKIKEMLTKCSGEVDRHLRDSKIGPKTEDQEFLHVDYPILPVRRRFWESSLRALDKGGIEGQLRTQLRLILDAAKSVANDSLGAVVTSDFIYDQIYPKLTQSGVLTKEINETILKQRDGTDDGQKRYQVAALIYLIGELSPNLGVKADAETLADLLVSDLNIGSTQLRKEIPDVLKKMLDSGDIMQIGKSYHIQTPEGSDWESDFRSNYANWMKDDVKIADFRYSLLKKHCTELLSSINLRQGKTNEPRKIELHFTLDKPQSSGEGIPIWIRDGWSESEKNIRNDAHQEGVDSPYVFVYLPKKNAQPLKTAIANLRASEETLELKGNPSGDEGKRARDAMITRRNQYENEVKVHMHDVFSQAIILQGGGNEIVESSFRDSVQKASEKALIRLYPDFNIGDNRDWPKVKDRVKKGDGIPLKVIGFSGETQDHEVCKEILKNIGGGKKGTEIRKFFSTAPFGWPKDTIDSALIALVGTGFLESRLSGVSLEAKLLDHTKIGKAEFRAIQVQFSVTDRIKVRKVLQEAGIKHKQNEELQVLPVLREKLDELVNSAGGEEPLPQKPSRLFIEELFSKSGNELGVALANDSENLLEFIKTWAATAKKIEQRKDRWERLIALVGQAKGFNIYEEINKNIVAIRSGRQLLDDPDPVPPVCNKLIDTLRNSINDSFQGYDTAFTSLENRLSQDTAWEKISQEQRDKLIHQENFYRLVKPQLGSEKDVQTSLEEISLESWKNRTDALAKRYENLRTAAIKLTEPKAIQVSLPSKTLRTEQEVDDYMSEAKLEIMKHIDNGNPVII